MTTNGEKSSEDVDMAEEGGDNVVTMMDVLREQQDFEDDANAVLGASDDKNCTYSKGYVKRQAIYACLTCCPDATTEPSKRAGVCLACSLACHERHELVELYTRRNFRCDCGNPKFTQPCTFTPDKSDLNYENKYNQNFSGIYCTCKRPYPDPEATEEEEMIQCIICEDWLHTKHLEATVPSNEQYEEMICKDCMDDYGFLHDYSDLVVNTADKEIEVMDPDLDFSPRKSTPTKAARKEMLTNGTPEDKTDMGKEDIADTSNNKVEEKTNDVESTDVEKNENITKESETDLNSTKETSNEEIEKNKETDANSDNAEPKDAVNDESAKQDESINKEIESNNKETESVNKEVESNNKEVESDNKGVESDHKKDESVNKEVESIDKESAKENTEEKPSDINTDKIESETNKKESADTSTETVEKPAPMEESQILEKKEENETSTTNKDESEDKPEVTENSSIETETENKRKRSISDEESSSPKKAKIDKPCVRPKGVKRVYKGATFWPANLRQKLCSCGECVAMYKDLAVLYLIDPEDTVNAYEALGKDNSEGPSSQYEKGLQALQSLDRVQQINALTEYNKMRDKLLDFLKSFKDRKEIVKEEDIKAFFAGMKPKREPDGVYFCR